VGISPNLIFHSEICRKKATLRPSARRFVDFKQTLRETDEVAGVQKNWGSRLGGNDVP
jgi:hypothetical protein